MRRAAVVALMIGLMGAGIAQVASARYSDAQPAESRESKVATHRAKVADYYESLKGKTFWLVPAKEMSSGPYPVKVKINFFNRLPQAVDYFEAMNTLSAGLFTLTDTDTFTIIDVSPSLNHYDDVIRDHYFIRVKFSDGREGYTEGGNIFGHVRGASSVDPALKIQMKGFDYVYSTDPALAPKPKASAKIARNAAPKDGVRIGMSGASVLASSWGRPQSVNRTTTASGTREQWVYGAGNYLYFENGVLTAVQN